MNPQVAIVVAHGLAEANRLRMPNVVIGHLVLGLARFGSGYSDINARDVRSRLRDGTAEPWLMKRAADLVDLSYEADPEWFFREVIKGAPATSEAATTGSSTAGVGGHIGLTAPHQLDLALAELDALTGLASVKDAVKELVAVHRLNLSRTEQELPVVSASLHLVLTGNPGTGKTTVARIMANIYAALGLLPSNKLVEVHRSGLVAEYVGHTAKLVEEVVKTAIGGVLFIDEAYALAGSSANDFGHEAIATLVKLMEDHRNRFAVIVAGYDKEMNTFIESNAGLRSRFQRFVHFPDYDNDQLATIFLALAAVYRIEVDTDVEQHVRRVISLADADMRTGNARSIRNLFEQSYARMAVRAGTIERANDAPAPSAFIVADIPQADNAVQPARGYV